MKKWILIQNEGLINELDLTSLGLSSKKGDSSKIGQFGSGWKYALAWLMRNDCVLRIFSGEREIMLDTVTILHRDQPVSFITVNGRQTDITLGFGEIGWTAWMALRELISNAIDEGGMKLTTEEQIAGGETGVTKIYVALNEATQNVMVNYHAYFCFDRIPTFENEHVRIFVRTELAKLNIYRKGIRCYDTNKTSYFDVDFKDIVINESRLTDLWEIDIQLRKGLEGDIPEIVWEALFKTDYKDWLPVKPTQSALNAIEKLRPKYRIESPININLLGALQMGLLEDDKPLLIIPDKYYKIGAESGIIQNESGVNNIEMIGDVPFLELNDERKDLLAHYLKNFGYPKQVLFGTMEATKEIVIYQDKILIKQQVKFTAEELAVLVIQTAPIKDVQKLLEPMFL